MLDHKTNDREETPGCCGCGGGKSATPIEGGTVIDPVCGMRVNPLTSQYRLEHGGQSHFPPGALKRDELPDKLFEI